MNYELDERYTLLPFAEADVGEQDIVDMWEREGVVDRRDGADRAREAICVGIDRDDGLVAVTTAYLDHSTQLRTQMWHLRGFVAAAHRRSSVGVHLLRATRLVMEGNFVAGEDRRAPGIMFELENEGVKGTRIEAVWRDDRISEGIEWTFIGENAKGDHLRVHYFAGAEISAP